MADLENLVPVNPAGNADQITRDYYDSLGFEERIIGGVEPFTETVLFGRTLSTPVMTAALSHLSMIAEDGSVQTAMAMKRLGGMMWLGMCEDAELEAVTATGANVVQVIKPYTDLERVIHKIDEGKKYGCAANGMDIDHAYRSDGTFGTDRDGIPVSTKSVEDIRRLVEASEGLPFVVKGILSVTDAERAVEAGAVGIVLSHHHGVFPFAVPPVMLLPEIRRAVGKDISIIVDCGIRDGSDAFKALALGADGVGIARGMQPTLKKAGEEGVYAYFKTVTDQLRGIMARTGTPTISAMNPTVIHRIR